MFDNLSEKLQNIISKTRTQELTQDNMQEALREIRRALLQGNGDLNLGIPKCTIILEKNHMSPPALGHGTSSYLFPSEYHIICRFSSHTRYYNEGSTSGCGGSAQKW